MDHVDSGSAKSEDASAERLMSVGDPVAGSQDDDILTVTSDQNEASIRSVAPPPPPLPAEAAADNNSVPVSHEGSRRSSVANSARQVAPAISVDDEGAGNPAWAKIGNFPPEEELDKFIDETLRLARIGKDTVEDAARMRLRMKRIDENAAAFQMSCHERIAARNKKISKVSRKLELLEMKAGKATRQ